jgi:hypothetical protein
MLMRLAVAGCFAAALLPTSPAPVSAPMGPARTSTISELAVSISVDAHGGRRGTVPVVVTLHHASRHTSATLDLVASDGSAGCTGRARFDGVRHVLTRTCSVRIPAGHAEVSFHGSAHVATGGTGVTVDSDAASVTAHSR